MADMETTIRIEADLLRLLNELAARQGRSRDELLADVLRTYFHIGNEEREAEISRQIVEAYERVPQTEELDPW